MESEQWSGKTINNRPEDTIFVFSTSHGADRELIFKAAKYGGITAERLNQVGRLKQKKKKKSK